MNLHISTLLLGGTAAVALAMAGVSCTGSYEDINSDPYQPGTLVPDDYAMGSALNNMAGTVMSADVNTIQFTDCLLGGDLAGYFSDANSGFQESIIHYNPKDDWSRVFLKSDQIIAKLYSNLNTIRAFAETSGDPVPLAVATIMKVAAMSRVADCYGPIPYTAIGKDGLVQTPYDDTKTVYYAFFDELQQAVDVLGANPGAALSPTSDFIYGGVISKWVKLANSLRLRLAVRIAGVDLAKAKAEAEAALAGGVITANADNASWDYFQASTNPLYTACNYNANASIAPTGGDTHAAADIICYMNGYNDPRRAAYFLPSAWDGKEYIGLRRGWETYANSWGFKFSGVKLATNSPLTWINAAEVAFLKAEAAAVYGISTGENPGDSYNNGIRLSFEQWGVEGADAYLADGTSVAEAYVDPSEMNPYNGALSTITIRWDDAASKDVKQERIITQKWIANWLNGNESWAELRRTGYPRLIPVASNRSGGVVDSNLGPQRMPYPQEEYTNNSVNVTYAVNHYLAGPDNQATRLWWAKK